MKHFLGGFAVGFFFALVGIPSTQRPTQMSNKEFAAYIAAHCLIATCFGVAAWGLLP